MQTHDKIRYYRELRKITQEDFADKLAMSPSGYSKLERGETKLTVERVQQIADILQVSIFDLIATGQSVIHNINGGVGININNGVLNYIDDKIEIERLNLIIKHKEEIIVQKTKRK